jgi:hypothetical protein
MTTNSAVSSTAAPIITGKIITKSVVQRVKVSVRFPRAAAAQSSSSWDG